MKFFITVVLLLSGSLFLASCQKELNFDTVPNLNDSTLLKTYVELDTLLSAPRDTLQKIELTYDNQKRITNIRTTRIKAETMTDIFLFYQGNSEHPFKSINYLKEFVTNTTDTGYAYYQFDVQGKCIYDSIKYNEDPSNTSTLVNWYQFSGTSVIHNFKLFIPPTFTVLENGINHTTLTNGLISSAIDTTYQRKEEVKTKLDYDAKVNPFQQMNFFPPMVRASFWNTDNFQSHNVTMIDQVVTNYGINNVIADHFTFQYKYNANNFPVSVVINSTAGNININKGLFFYTNK